MSHNETQIAVTHCWSNLFLKNPLLKRRYLESSFWASIVKLISANIYRNNLSEISAIRTNNWVFRIPAIKKYYMFSELRVLHNIPDVIDKVSKLLNF